MSTVNQIALAALIAALLVIAYEFARWLLIDQKDKALQRKYEQEIADLNAQRAKSRREHDHGDWSRPE